MTSTPSLRKKSGDQVPAGTFKTERMKIFLFLLVLAGCFCTAGARAADNPPNFVFVYADDQRYDALGVVQREQAGRARFPWFKTPNMDRLAAEGVRFRNAFATSSLCSPSRASFLTGLYNHFNGVVNNHTPFPTNSVTYASVLRSAGYKTGYIGKWHMGQQRGQRPGFDFSASYIAHGRYIDCPFEFNGVSKPTIGWVDDVAANLAIDFLRTNKSGPFALVVGFKSPHGPRTPPDRWKTAFAGEEARPAANQDARAPYVAPGKPGANPHGEGLRDYFRCIAAEDEDLGRILNALDEFGLTQNTMVIYSSDNGYYLGDHGLGDKRSAYEESMRIPMLLRYPKLGLKGGAVVDESVLNIDFAPTLIDFAGLPVPASMQGHSWRPLLQRAGDVAPNWRHSFFYEYFYERPYEVPTLFAVRTDSAKLIKYKDHDEWTELFDLARDPYETNNLAPNRSEADFRARMNSEFESQKQASGYVWPANADSAAAPSAVGKAAEAWVLDFHFDTDQQDTVMDASGKGNNGRAHNAALVDGRAGGKARRFGGDGWIDVPKAASLNPAVPNWTVEATIRPDADGLNAVILAQGGESYGYCLSLDNGVPIFTVVNRKQKTRVKGRGAIGAEWATLRAAIAPGELRLSINGGPAQRQPMPASLGKDPNESLQIGDDLGTAVLAEEKPPAFKGLVESVRIYSGALPEKPK